MTLTLGAEEVELPHDAVKQIRDRLVAPLGTTQDLYIVLTEALQTGSGRIVEAHRLDLVSVIEAVKNERPGDYRPELHRLRTVAQKPIIPKPD